MRTPRMSTNQLVEYHSSLVKFRNSAEIELVDKKKWLPKLNAEIEMINNKIKKRSIKRHL